MRKYAIFVVSAAFVAATLTGCGGEDEFCGRAVDIVGENGVPDADALQRLADEAPDELKDDFQVLADAMNDPSSADQNKVQEAQSNILQWGDDHCDN